VILACTVLLGLRGVTLRRTDRQTDRQTRTPNSKVSDRGQKTAEKTSVLRHWKIFSDGADATVSNKLFYARAVATVKTQSSTSKRVIVIVIIIIIKHSFYLLNKVKKIYQ